MTTATLTFADTGRDRRLIDNTDLGELSRTADWLKRYTYLFTAAPIRVKTGTGVPANPIATF